MDSGQRRFTGHQYQPAAFLQTDVSSPEEQVFAVAGHDARHSFHAARDDDHTHDLKAAAGNRSAGTIVIMIDGSQGLQFIWVHSCFLPESQPATAGDYQVGFDLRMTGTELPHQLYCQRRAGGTADTNDQPFTHGATSPDPHQGTAHA